MKPYLEYLTAPGESSWTLFDRRLPQIPFVWHYNSEYELTLTLNSRGQRFIGDDISAYDDGDLVLIPPKIPHTWCSKEAVDSSRQHQAIVLWFTEAFLSKLIDPHIELRLVRQLFRKSSRGLVFSARVRRVARSTICGMLSQTPAQRLVTVMELFLLLAADRAAKPITGPRTVAEPFAEETEERICRVVAFLNANYRNEIHIPMLTQLAGLSRSSLFRLFKHQTSATVTRYLAQLRVANACGLLLNTQKPVAVISSEVGYNNLAHFNRQFKLLRKRTPREFRNAFEKAR